uniref:uncharacterized protein LOC100175345 isoform X2 n=1 Tax=Ciona intestinalis TaxID=7719 RepID=UPI000EF4E6DA|nr:uncharacterized protein LOC100175345 isoform X2 [Ciona intestinalis]|eukprot:XP_026690568.1 uncharacterized protein LOC100175345 isoform X2 [Ciona intestinalis]
MNVTNILIVLFLVFRNCNGDHMQGGSVSWRVMQENDDGTFKIQHLVRYQSSRPCSKPDNFRCESRTDGCSDYEDLVIVDYTCPNTINLGITSTTSQSVVYSVEKKYEDITRIVRIGCPEAIKIHTLDQDVGDVVTCRFGNAEIENGDIQIYSHLSMNEEECELVYNGGGSAGEVAVSIITEDRKGTAGMSKLKAVKSQQPMSYSSHQFILKISNGPQQQSTCYDRPTFIDPTPPDQHLLRVAGGTTYNKTISIQGLKGGSIEHLSVVSSFDVTKSNIVQTNTHVYEVELEWVVDSNDTGTNYICYTAWDSNSFVSNQQCFFVEVNGGCSKNNGGCTDNCIVLENAGEEEYKCECGRSCWELHKDQRTCMPKLEHNCDNDQIEIRVPKCAVDGPIGVGNFDSDVTPPPECRSVDSSTHHVFRFNKYQCDTVNSENIVQSLYQNVVTMWIEDPKEDSSGTGGGITRGSWYEIDSTCTKEKAFDTEGEYNPEDTTTTIVVEEGFGQIDISFDYYTDETFQEAYSPYDYPVDFDVGSNMYFAIEAECDKSEVELFTEQCVAQPEPRPPGVEDYIMLDEGCIIDKTMKCYPSTNPMINQFSIEAFRFSYETAGVTENTNVLIKCSVLVCVQNDTTSRCYKGCIEGYNSASSNNLINRKSRQNLCPSIYKQPQAVTYSNNSEELPHINKVDPKYVQTDLIPLVDPNVITIKSKPETTTDGSTTLLPSNTPTNIAITTTTRTSEHTTTTTDGAHALISNMLYTIGIICTGWWIQFSLF